MRKTLFLSMALLLAAPCGLSAINPKEVKPVKNIILLITDGTSISTVSLARWMQYYQDPTKPKLYIDPYLCGTVRTNCSDAPIGDSAPTTSCYVTGYASRSGYVSTFPPDHGKDNIDPIDGAKAYGPIATLLEAAKQLQGKSTGLVVTCQFPHATPADCSAHYYNRGAYFILADQQVHNNLDVVIGGGNNYLTPENEQFLKDEGYSVFRNDKDGMLQCKNNKMWALYGDVDMAYEVDRDPSKQLSLAEHTQIALDKLSKNSKGFFLMVEGSKVDWAAHGNDIAAISDEFLAFDKACGVAFDFARKHGNTAVIVVPDHGNSGLSIGTRRCGNYSKATKDEMFHQIAQYKMSSDVLLQKIQSEPNSKLAELFLENEGIALTDDEIALINNHKEYKQSPIPVGQRYERKDNPAFSPSLHQTIKQILTLHTCMAWTTGGHTGEDVFLATYHPKGTRPLGMSTNVELAHYMQACFGLYGKMDQFTDKIFAHHDKVFAGYDIKVDEGGEGVRPKLTVTNPKNGKTLTVEAFTNVAQVGGTANKTVKTASVMTYVDRTKKFYVPQDLANLIK